TSALYDLVCFFFSSRRRHTRFSRDWSSDVCSSDLLVRVRHKHFAFFYRCSPGKEGGVMNGVSPDNKERVHELVDERISVPVEIEIGRASRRERRGEQLEGCSAPAEGRAQPAARQKH